MTTQEKLAKVAHIRDELNELSHWEETGQGDTLIHIGYGLSGLDDIKIELQKKSGVLPCRNRND